MKILKFPDPHLFKPTKPVTVFGEELAVLLEAMWTIMRNAKGLGLASNQIGLDYSMFTMLGPNDEKLFIVNPKIVSRSVGFANLREGCLSAPGQILVVPDRAKWVQVEFQDEKSVTKTRVFQDIHSVCVQHEMEHLEGKVFMQNKTISKSQRKELAAKWGFKLK